MPGLSDDAGAVLVRAGSVFLLALGAASVATARGTLALAQAVVFVVMAAAIAYGAFTGRLRSRPVQVALTLGVAAYGGVRYVATGSLLWAFVAGGGVVLAVRTVLGR